MSKKGKNNHKKNKTENIQYKNENSTDYKGSLESYYQLIQIEFNSEKERKQGLETRIGYILTLFVAFIAVILDKVKFLDILELTYSKISFWILLKIIFGFGIYVSFIGCIYSSLKGLLTNPYATYEINNINSSSLSQDKNKGLFQIIIDYKNIIKENRILNNGKAKSLEWTIRFIIICIICVCFYLNIPGGKKMSDSYEDFLKGCEASETISQTSQISNSNVTYQQDSQNSNITHLTEGLKSVTHVNFSENNVTHSPNE
ncbi:hypothetical protein SAMN02745152_02130 [Treponema berlinense]|uniref:Uncharacterized protein n=1 Tax=Treponema berlinense TaxID=225004 RepID=A0A1T4QV78_9SPIR|nr:hypothetical protein [Treponema berlinense]SKA07679.1 hypothetical protein SAMN02745152_02130 [Treponema berlinense]